jgi:putative FmdB family regulatory protein
MPVYEFYCPPCATQFEVLRPMSKSDEPAVCPSGHVTANRVLSMFATFTKTADGAIQEFGGGAGCACGGACSCGAAHGN